MLKLIRQALQQSTDLLQGDVEMDAAYIGGRKAAGKNNADLAEAMAAKTAIMGSVKRQGGVRVYVVRYSDKQRFELLLDTLLHASRA